MSVPYGTECRINFPLSKYPSRSEYYSDDDGSDDGDVADADVEAPTPKGEGFENEVKLRH